MRDHQRNSGADREGRRSQASNTSATINNINTTPFLLGTGHDIGYVMLTHLWSKSQHNMTTTDQPVSATLPQQGTHGKSQIESLPSAKSICTADHYFLGYKSAPEKKLKTSVRNVSGQRRSK
jgi:hypothetical protein